MNALLLFLATAIGAADEPAAGRFYREFWYQPGVEFGNPVVNSRFRVNSPESVLHPEFGLRRETCGNGMMQIAIDESLFDLAGAELYLELWGGHPGTANKRVTVNGRSTYALPKVGTEEHHCTHQYPAVPLKLTDLVSGSSALQFACDQGESFLGHFIVDGACLRTVLKRGHTLLEERGLEDFSAKAEAERDDAAEAFQLRLAVPEMFAEKIAAVEFHAFYEGYDENGNGQSRDWHGFTKAHEPMAVLGVVAEQPFAAIWDVSMLPAQADMAVKAVVRFREPADLCYETAPAAGLSTPERHGTTVSLHRASEPPAPFWSRAGRKATAAIPLDVDPARVERAELHVVTWRGGPGKVPDYFMLNGRHFPVAEGSGHDVCYSRLPSDPAILRRGDNEIIVHSDTEHHGIEVLLPGPAIVVRYSSR